MMKKKIIVTLLILGSIVAGCGKKANPELQIENYQPVEEFQAAYEALKERKADINKEYDIEETVRILNGLEMAQAKSDDFYSFLEYMAKQDYSMVASDVIDAKIKILPLLQQMFKLQKQYKEFSTIWMLVRSAAAGAKTLAKESSTTGAGMAAMKAMAGEGPLAIVDMSENLSIDAAKNAALMKELNTTGKYEITSEMKEKLADFYGNYASEKETADTIRDLYEKTGYVIDTHTAVAASVYHKYKKDTNDAETKTVIASTASPFKFSRSVMDAIDPKYDSLSEFELVDELSKIGNVKIPQAIEEIRSAEVRHKTVCEVEEMPKVVKQFLGM